LNKRLSRLRLQVDFFDLDRAGVNVPVADAFGPLKSFLGRLHCPLRAARRANNDRSLAATKKPAVARYLIQKANAIDRHGLFLPNRRAVSHDARRMDLIFINISLILINPHPIDSGSVNFYAGCRDA
jgi:hypothetical protein